MTEDLHGRDVAVLQLVHRHCTPYYLALTVQGYPKHPLYIRGDAVPIAWANEGTSGLPHVQEAVMSDERRHLQYAILFSTATRAHPLKPTWQVRAGRAGYGW